MSEEQRWPRIAAENSPVADPRMILKAFNSMGTETKTLVMGQLLGECPNSILRIVAGTVNPILKCLKCDFLLRLPPELRYHILSFLDHHDLCRAAQVSKHWRRIVDGNEAGWKELFDRDGYELTQGELDKAVTQGWGWQDPVGWSDCERDLSAHRGLTPSNQEDTLVSNESTAATQSGIPKRKRDMSTDSVPECPKKRTRSQDSPSGRIEQYKSAEQLSAVHSAATAVPDPGLGLPSLRQLHLFKSLYRRHHMIRESWMNGKVKPSHVAFAAHAGQINCLQFDDDKIVTASEDTFIHVYDTKTGKLRNKLAGHEQGVWALQYEGNVVVSGSIDYSVRVWDIETGECLKIFDGHRGTVRCLQILASTEAGRHAAGGPIMQPKTRLVISGSRDKTLRVWRLPELTRKFRPQGEPPAPESDCSYFVRSLSGHAAPVRAISAHGDTVVSGSYDSTVRVWCVSTGECLHVLQGHADKVYSVVLDHERNRCISGSADSFVKIWDLATGACLHTLDGHSGLVGLLGLRDGMLVSASNSLRIRNPENGRYKNALMVHSSRTLTCFQHDGRKIISGAGDSVKMWNAKTGQLINELLAGLDNVYQVKFDSRRCVAVVDRNDSAYVEILDFGAIRDGLPPEELGRRVLL